MKKMPFRIYIKLDRLFCITFSLIYLFVLLCECGLLPYASREYSIIALFFIFFSFVRFEFRVPPIADIVIPVINSFIVTIILQYMLSADPSLLNTVTLAGNIALNAGLTFLFLLITNKIRLSVTLSNILLFGFAFIDYLVISFRGSEIKFSDIYSVGTAASVVSQYKTELNTPVLCALAVFAFLMFVLWITKISYPSKKNQLPRISGLLFLGASLFAVSWCMNHSTNYMQLWGFNGVKYNGLTYNFLIEARDSRVVPPDGYSDEKAKDLLASYPETESVEDTPHIIVIMSEAFADLSILGDMELSKDPLEFYNSLTENCKKGYAMSSVFGGNTATSEWEFLTGNTQAFLPYGSVAYQQYIKKEADSLVDVMNANDYTTIAMHPYLSTGWKRNVVYDVFGFDEIYFQDELSKDGKIRDFVSDASLFSDIISRFEKKKEGEKLFTFAITMQNHGGYEYGNFPSEVTVKGLDVLGADQYLTLLNKSDDALRDFITYFENTDEKTMIVLFGDHQPSLNNSFYAGVMGENSNTYEGTMAKYTVPFMIWTNYDTEESLNEFTSLNYLSAMVLEEAGIGLTPYFSYLNYLRRSLPVISYFAYYSNADGRLKRVSEATEKELNLINEYKTVQYYNMFKT